MINFAFSEWFGELFLRGVRAYSAAGLRALPPGHLTLPESHEGNHGVYHQHKQRAICIRGRRGSEDTTAEMDAVLRFRHVNTVFSIVVGIRPGSVRRQVNFFSIWLTIYHATYFLLKISPYRSFPTKPPPLVVNLFLIFFSFVICLCFKVFYSLYKQMISCYRNSRQILVI